LTSTEHRAVRPEPNQSVEHAFAILELFAAAPEPLGVVEISRRLDLSIGTCHRVLATLCASGFARQLHDGGKYVPGLRVQELLLALYSHFPIRAKATPTLHSLTAQSGLASILSVPLGNVALRIAGVPDRLVLHRPLRLGLASELHIGAAPRVLLAFAEERRRTDYLRRHVPEAGERAEVARELADIRETGHLMVLEEGMQTLALPVCSADGVAVAAISLEGAAAHFRAPGARQLKAWRKLVGDLEAQYRDDPAALRGPFDHLPWDSIELHPRRAGLATEVESLPLYPATGLEPPALR
jgi:DNA-binding IclR family transcriptional regulator